MIETDNITWISNHQVLNRLRIGPGTLAKLVEQYGVRRRQTPGSKQVFFAAEDIARIERDSYTALVPGRPFVPESITWISGKQARVRLRIGMPRLVDLARQHGVRSLRNPVSQRIYYAADDIARLERELVAARVAEGVGV